MSDDMITGPGEQDTEDSPGLARRAAGGLRSSLTGEAATALAAGSRILLSRGWGYVAPRLTVGERWLYGAGAGYVVIHTAVNVDLGTAGPFVLPGAMVVWCTAAWVIAPPPQAKQVTQDAGHEPETVGPEPDDDLPDFDELLALVRKVAAGAQGAHLEDLLETGAFGPLSKAELKALLTDEYELPVESFGIRVNGHKRTRDGVRLRHLPRTPAEPPPEGPAETAPTTPG